MKIFYSLLISTCIFLVLIGKASSADLNNSRSATHDLMVEIGKPVF